MISAPADLAIFLGDNIYADTSDMAVMRAKYDHYLGLASSSLGRPAMPVERYRSKGEEYV